MSQSSVPLQVALATNQTNKAMQTLMGIVTGIVADGELVDKEIHFLRIWLRENTSLAEQWPASAIYRLIQQVLADGLVTPEERDNLLQHLQQLVQVDFSQTGAAIADSPALPVDDEVTVVLTNSGVCHTGEFLFGTRAAVERATLRAGGMPVDSVTRRTDLVVIGTRVSPHWVGTTYGRKIQRAVELRDAGAGLEIISERRWLAAIGMVE